jgi:hypothetical protein
MSSKFGEALLPGEDGGQFPAVIVIAEDPEHERQRRRGMQAGVIVGVLASVAIGVAAPQVFNKNRTSISSSTEAAAATFVSIPSAAPVQALAISPLPDAEAVLEARGVRVRPLSAEDASALPIATGVPAFRVSNVAPHVSSVAPDDIVLGSCNEPAAEKSTALRVCFVRDGKIIAGVL